MLARPLRCVAVHVSCPYSTTCSTHDHRGKLADTNRSRGCVETVGRLVPYAALQVGAAGVGAEVPFEAFLYTFAIRYGADVQIHVVHGLKILFVPCKHCTVSPLVKKLSSSPDHNWAVVKAAL